MKKTNIVKFQSKWGVGKKNKGLGSQEIAKRWVTQFPKGTTVTPEEFDEWGIAQGILEEPHSKEKGSNEWNGHLSKRNRLRYRINAAGMHSRMGEDTFVIRVINRHEYEVQSCTDAILKGKKIWQKIRSQGNTSMQNMLDLIHSEEYRSLPERKLMRLEAICEQQSVYVSLISDIAQKYMALEIERKQLRDQND